MAEAVQPLDVATRMVVVWCPDWPVVSWGLPLDEPAAVLVANRVVATSPAAREDGVRAGQRRREAQGRCPMLALLDRDVDRENRLFEPVVAALDAITPRVEVAGPGLVGFPTRGPARFFGGEESLAGAVVEAVGRQLPRRVQARVAIADGVFAARLAARSRDQGAGPDEGIRVVRVGESASFLTPLPITTLEMPELTDVLVRLGLETLGRFAELPAADVVDRFGRDGRLAHRLAQGLDDHPPDLRRPAPDLAVSWTFDPPADRVERCAFVIKTLADDLHANLDSRGLSCTRVAIEAETETGERQMRLWRHQGSLSAAAVADRARWQLDGWLNQTAAARPKSGILRLTIVPDEVVPATGRQLGFWGGDRGRADDVTRVVARLQTILGADALTVPEFKGGLTAGEQIRMVPAAAVDLTEDRPAAQPDWNQEPWPGRIPAPAPLRVHPDPLTAELRDHAGVSLGVTGRGELSGRPGRLEFEVDGRPKRRLVNSWAGPWPAEQRWWDPLSRRRRARMQVILDDGTAHLLVLERQQWYIEASYR